MSQKIHSLVCQSTDSIETIFHQMDLENSSLFFVVDANHCLIGQVEREMLKGKVHDGAFIGDMIEKYVVKDVPYIFDTDLEVPEDLHNKIMYLRHHYKISDTSFVPVCDNAMHVLTVKKVEAFMAANVSNYILSPDIIKKREDVIKNVCVIGGAGYFGTVLSEKLLSQGYNVKIFDKFVFGKEPIINLTHTLASQDTVGSLEVYEGDMRNISDVMRVLEQVDAVIVLGAVVGDPASSKYPTSAFEVNYLATQTIAETCAYLNINRFIFASTCSVYGFSATDKSLTENSTMNPVSHYARTKINAEQAILAVRSPNFAPTIMRMSTLYGPSYRMRYDLVVNTMMMKGITTKKISIFGGDQWRPLLSVHDAAQAFLSVIHTDIETIRRQVYNVGDEKENYQIQVLGGMIAHFLKGKGIEVDVEVIPNTADLRDYQVSFEKIKKELNFSPTHTVKSSLEEIYAIIMNQFEKDKVAHPSHYNDQIEITSDARGNLWPHIN